jgi:hypothetical protein
MARDNPARFYGREPSRQSKRDFIELLIAYELAQAEVFEKQAGSSVVTQPN